jgi:hypothetical protein
MKTDKKVDRDPLCVVAGCKLDGRNCDPSECTVITGEAAKEVLPEKGPMLCQECGAYHGEPEK